MTTQNELIIETHGGIRILTLNRPESANALSPTLSSAIVDAFIDADRDPDVRVIVLTGTGERAFCAGMDLKLRSQADSARKRMPQPNRGRGRLTYEVVLETWKPTIAAINGYAVGGGFELSMACDLRIAADHTYFCLPEARRGLGAQFATVMLPRLVPLAVAYELLYTGNSLDAVRAAHVGFVNQIVPASDLMTAAMDLAGQIAQNAPITLRRMKETTVRASGMPLATALRLNEGRSPYESADRREDISAFVEKRQPVWKGE